MRLAQKIQTALLRNYDIVVFIEKEQFYSTKQNRVITMLILCQRVYNEEKGRFEKKQLIKSADGVSILRYLVKMYEEVKDKRATQ